MFFVKYDMYIKQLCYQFSSNWKQHLGFQYIWSEHLKKTVCEFFPIVYFVNLEFWSLMCYNNKMASCLSYHVFLDYTHNISMDQSLPSAVKCTSNTGSACQLYVDFTTPFLVKKFHLKKIINYSRWTSLYQYQTKPPIRNKVKCL